MDILTEIKNKKESAIKNSGEIPDYIVLNWLDYRKMIANDISRLNDSHTIKTIYGMEIAISPFIDEGVIICGFRPMV